MNFRFTKIKTPVSVIIPAIIGLYFFITERGINLDVSTSLVQMLANKFGFFIFWFVLLFVPIYVIWSLFEKKEQKAVYSKIGIIIGILILLAIIFVFLMKSF